MSGDKSSDVISDQFVNQSCFDFLLIELVPMAYRLAQEAADLEAESTSPSMAHPDENDVKESVYYRLDTLGYRVGQGLAEKFSRDKPRPQEPLDAIKFLCKDLWTVVFKKQIDNLKTNHRGVFVLTDNHFPPLRRMSLVRGVGIMGAQQQQGGQVQQQNPRAPQQGQGHLQHDSEAQSLAGTASVSTQELGGQIDTDAGMALALPFLYFPSGIVRGVLASLGIVATVTAEVGGLGLPSAVFQIRTALEGK